MAIARNKTNEDELKAKELSYWVDPQRGLLYVEKTRLQKLTDYVIRTVGTPVTVAVDAATSIAVVGAVVFVITHVPAAAQTMEASLEATRREREEKEMESVRELLDTVRREEKEHSSTTPHGTGFVRP